MDWPPLPVGVGAPPVHAHMSEIRRRIARAFVGTRSVSDAMGVVVLVNSDSASPLPLRRSVNLRMATTFQHLALQQAHLQGAAVARHGSDPGARPRILWHIVLTGSTC